MLLRLQRPFIRCSLLLLLFFNLGRYIPEEGKINEENLEVWSSIGLIGSHGTRSNCVTADDLDDLQRLATMGPIFGSITTYVCSIPFDR